LARYSIPYGREELELNLTDDKVLTFADQKPTRPKHPVSEIKKALETPVSSLPLRKLTKEGKRVVVLVNDITRSTPTSILLPFILKELELGKVNREDIQIIVATGLHRINTEEEIRKIVGEEVFEVYRTTCHNPEDAENLVSVGVTRLGTQLIFNKKVVEADLRVLTGDIEPHQLAGFTGGAKSILPGVSSTESIEKNHSLLMNTNVRAGVIEGNPLREDIDESINFLGQSFLLNLVLNSKNELVRAVAGNVLRAHRQGVKVCTEISKVHVPELADIVVASPGGFPKDIDLYQAQKAITQAENAVKRGGVVILVAKCEEGVGNELFREWMSTYDDPKEIMEHMKNEGFKMGAHKAFLFARSMVNVDLIIVSDIRDKILEEMHLKAAKNLSEALELAYNRVGARGKVTILPHASSNIIFSPLKEQ